MSFSVADAVLRDGSTVRVRVATRSDGEAVLGFFRSLSPESRYKRFFGFAIPPLEVLIPEGDGRALIAIHAGRVVGHAVYRVTGRSAEVGVAVADDFQNRGLGTILVGMISELAYRDGVEEVEALTLPENAQMINVLRNLGFPYRVRVEPGAIRIVYATSNLPQAVEAFDKREALGVRQALRKFLEPSTIVVVGASRFRGTVGGELFHNIIDGGYTGVCFPVNRNARAVQAVPAYQSVREIPQRVDLGIIAVPAKSVLEAARECIEKGVGGLVVISAGFAEVGEEGRRLQEELLALCREHGVRLIGPNCMGLVNTDPKISLNAQFSPQKPLEGNIGFLSQSGALGITVLDYTRRLGLGLSSFVSVGNKADISGNDLLEYWEEDERTRAILLYLESFGNPRKFSRIARRVSRRKPIVVVKAGRTHAGSRAAQSHTGAMLSASDVTVDALFRQSGVIRVDSLSQLFDVAALLTTQPLPRSRGVGIVTNAGGAGILAADACEAAGLSVPELSRETQEELRSFLPPIASTRNPVDMSAEAEAEHYHQAIRAVAKDPAIGSILVIFIPPIAIREEEVAQSILRGAGEAGGVTVAAVFLGRTGIPQLLRGGGLSIPSYAFPEDAVFALSKAAEYAEWRNTPPSPYVTVQGVDRVGALSLAARALGRGEGWMDQLEAYRLLELYGIPHPKTFFAATPEEAESRAAELGGEVVLKGYSKQLVHKSDVGAVKLGLKPGEIGEAAREMLSRLPLEGFLVQEMVKGGVEMLLGVTQDPTFGPVVACGFGGVYTELVKDVSVRLTPLTERDVDEMVQSLKLYPLLAGYRGGQKRDVEALKDVIRRVGVLVEDIPQIVEMDINPLMVLEKGALAVDVRIRLGRTPIYVPVGAKSAA